MRFCLAFRALWLVGLCSLLVFNVCGAQETNSEKTSLHQQCLQVIEGEGEGLYENAKSCQGIAEGPKKWVDDFCTSVAVEGKGEAVANSIRSSIRRCRQPPKST